MIKKPLPPDLLARCRSLREQQTPAEKLMWGLLRNRQLNGSKFPRQHPFSGYILDFYCHEARLVVELDGGGHAEDGQVKSNLQRTKALESRGLRVLRFWNNEVTQKTEGVLQVIWDALTAVDEEG